jgi:hypothetical protein
MEPNRRWPQVLPVGFKEYPCNATGIGILSVEEAGHMWVGCKQKPNGVVHSTTIARSLRPCYASEASAINCFISCEPFISSV